MVTADYPDDTDEEKFRLLAFLIRDIRAIRGQISRCLFRLLCPATYLR